MNFICSSRHWILFLCLPASLLFSATDRLAWLEAEIARHDHLYWEALAPEISDEAYDALVAERNQWLADEAHHLPLHPTDPGQIQHRWPMLSLQKLHTAEDLKKFTERISPQTGAPEARLRLEPKWDGVALNLVYHNGQWVKAVTRGNGIIGQDVTSQVRATTHLPYQLPIETPPEYLEIRGEFFATNRQFEKINQQRQASGEDPYRHPRHMAAATLRTQDLDAVSMRALSFVAFDLKTAHPKAMTQSEIVELLSQWGFPVPDNAWSNVKTEAADGIIRAFAAKRAQLPYPTDGLVIKLESRAEQKILGQTERAPRHAAAWKYPGATAITTVESVTKSIGETGRITPVAQVKPVTIDGIQIQNISLHSPNHQQQLGIKKGSQIKIHLAGGVIPAILEVLNLPQQTP